MNKLYRILRRGLNLIFYIVGYNKRHSLNILNTNETLREIIDNKKSISRYGDGEFDIIFNYLRYSHNKCGFQTYSSQLAIRLIEILKAEPLNNHLIGLSGGIGSVGVRKFIWEDIRYWQNYLRQHLNHIHTIISIERKYGDSNFTRFYMPLRDKKNVKSYVNELKRIWANRDVLIIEGCMTRMGVNNDLLLGAKSIRRILAPTKDAFSKYDVILETVISYLKTRDINCIVLVSLGPTATVLTYDLAKAGYQAIDTGHIDLEYEWMLRGVKEKVKVDGRYVNEVVGEDYGIELNNSEYENQIITRIE